LTREYKRRMVDSLSMTQRHSALRKTWKREALSGQSCVLDYAFGIVTLANPEDTT
jgi:hypothetical protein